MQVVSGGKISILGDHSIGHSKQERVYVHLSCSERFWRQLFHCIIPKLLIRKRYYILFLIPVLTVQVKHLVRFPKYNTYSKIPPTTSMHFGTRVRTWRVARLYSEIALSWKPFGIGHMYIYSFFLRMIDTVTSQNTDLSSWDTRYFELQRQIAIDYFLSECVPHLRERIISQNVFVFYYSNLYVNQKYTRG
jgi:hypothetical protein